MHIDDIDGPSPAAKQAVTLTNIHAPKGAEWPVVFVVAYVWWRDRQTSSHCGSGVCRASRAQAAQSEATCLDSILEVVLDGVPR